MSFYGTENTCLDFNVKKTKEIIINFREKNPVLKPIKINNIAVDVVKSYKYLGSIIDDKLKNKWQWKHWEGVQEANQLTAVCIL